MIGTESRSATRASSAGESSTKSIARFHSSAVCVRETFIENSGSSTVITRRALSFCSGGKSIKTEKDIGRSTDDSQTGCSAQSPPTDVFTFAKSMDSPSTSTAITSWSIEPVIAIERASSVRTSTPSYIPSLTGTMTLVSAEPRWKGGEQ